MRHWIGMILAVVMAGVLFFAGAWGYLRLLRLPAAAGQLAQLPGGGGSLISDHSQLYAIAAIAGTGLLAGILIAVPRISPLAAGLPGLVLVGWTGLYLVGVHRAVSLIPLRSYSFGAGFEAMLLNGILPAVGLAMIIPLFVPSRWRSRRISDDEIAETEGDDEYITMLGRPGQAETVEEPALVGRVERRTPGTRVPTPADLPASFNDTAEPVVPWASLRARRELPPEMR
jgi:hypothetical protein